MKKSPAASADRVTVGRSASYSQVQYFFWLLSGCEISVLKECPTDFNRQAGIGFTIFMTTVFAAFAGGYAGYYFSNKSIAAAILFGLLWSALVFSIDRSMVVTLKKDPTASKQNFWMPFAGRGVLSLLIAFIISLPLEILIFRSQIEIQKRFDAPNQLADLEALYKKAGNYNLNKEGRNDANKEAETALQAGSDCLNDGEYASLSERYKPLTAEANKAAQTLQGFQVQYQNKRAAAAQNTEASARAAAYRRARDFFNSSNFQSARNEAAVLNKERSILKAQMDTRCTQFREEQKTIARDKKTKADKLGIEMDTTQALANRQKDTLRKMLTDNFIRDFIALENAAVQKVEVEESIISPQAGNNAATMQKVVHTKYANSGLLFFIWLIRILFFVIELLPTVAKIATPVGAYDVAVYQYEQDFKKELDARTTQFVDHQLRMKELSYNEEQRLLKEQQAIEGKVRKSLIEEIAKAQDDVARQKIKEYRKKHLKNAGVNEEEVPI